MTKENFIKSLSRFLGTSVADAPKTKSKDNLYLVSCNYCSHYDDDDCYFTYINSETGQVSSDTWTTRGACPSWFTYLRMPVLEAIEEGYFPKEVWDNYCEDRWLFNLNYIADSISKYGIDHEKQSKYHLDGLYLPCKVSRRCQTYKGIDATLLRYEKEYDSYRGCNVWKAKILGNDNKIHTCSARLPEVDWAAVADKIKANINSDVQSEEELVKSALGATINTDNCTDVRLDAKNQRYDSFKESKMPGLIEWCKSKAPQKSEDEIKEWAESIFARKYPRR